MSVGDIMMSVSRCVFISSSFWNSTSETSQPTSSNKCKMQNTKTQTVYTVNHLDMRSVFCGHTPQNQMKAFNFSTHRCHSVTIQKYMTRGWPSFKKALTLVFVFPEIRTTTGSYFLRLQILWLWFTVLIERIE